MRCCSGSWRWLCLYLNLPTSCWIIVKTYFVSVNWWISVWSRHPPPFSAFASSFPTWKLTAALSQSEAPAPPSGSRAPSRRRPGRPACGSSRWSASRAGRCRAGRRPTWAASTSPEGGRDTWAGSEIRGIMSTLVSPNYHLSISGTSPITLIFKKVSLWLWVFHVFVANIISWFDGKLYWWQSNLLVIYINLGIFSVSKHMFSGAQWHREKVVLHKFHGVSWSFIISSVWSLTAACDSRKWNLGQRIKDMTREHL